MEQQPIIIKKIIKHGHGHHGGSWKVAYADFVTAMMAFFLLMWLMGFTTEGERKAISDYFQNPSAIQGKGGSSTSLIDMGKGMDSPRTNEKKPNQDTTSVNAKDTASEAPGDTLAASEDAKKLMTEADKKRLEALQEELKQAIDASQALKPFKDQLLIDITPEGLRIQIVDKENRPMFDVGSANLQSYTRAILREISKTISSVPNRISIAGHTDGRAYAAGADYSNWELSTERANACRRELVAGGVAEGKVARVVGLASTALFDKSNPLSPINRRISIIVLNRETEEAMMKKEENEKRIESETRVTAETLGTTSEPPKPEIVAPPEPVKPAAPPEPVKRVEPAPVPARAVEVSKPLPPAKPVEPVKAVELAPAKPVEVAPEKPAVATEKPLEKTKADKNTSAKKDVVPPANVPDSIKLPTAAPAIQLPGLPINTPGAAPVKRAEGVSAVPEKAAAEKAVPAQATPSEKPKDKPKADKKSAAKTDAAPPSTAPDSIKLPGVAPAIQLPGLPITTPATGGFAPQSTPSSDPTKPKP